MNEQTYTKLWSNNFIIVSFINFLLMFTYYMLLVTISAHVVNHFHASQSIAGLVTGLMVLGCLAGRFVTGYLIGVIGCKKVLFVGITIFIVTMTLYLVAVNLPLLMIARFISGIAVGMVGTVTGTIVVYVVPAARRGEGISYFSMSTILAAALGPFAGLFLMQYVPFSALLFIGLVTGIIAFVIAMMSHIGGIIMMQSERSSHKIQLSDFIEARAINISLVLMIAGIGYAGVQVYIAFYAVELNLFSIASLFFIFYALTVLVSRPITGKIIDIKGENILVYPALIIQSVGFVLLSQAQSATQFLLSAVFIGLGFGNFQTIAQVIAVKVSPINKVGQATSTFFILFDFGLGFGPYFLGLLIPYLGYRGLYLFCAVVGFSCLILYYFLHGRKKYSPEIIDETQQNSDD